MFLKWTKKLINLSKLAKIPLLAELLLFISILIIYNISPRPIGSHDTIPAEYLPYSILKELDFDLDEFPQLYNQPRQAHTIRVNDHYVSKYPVFTPLIAIPIWLLFNLSGIHNAQLLAKLCSNVLIALSALFIYRSILLLGSRRQALLITSIYSFGSCV